jgi:hypothetical protein
MADGSVFGCIVGKCRRADFVTASLAFHAAECCGHDDPPCYLQIINANRRSVLMQIKQLGVVLAQPA